MFLFTVESGDFEGDSVEKELPIPNLQLDPRPIFYGGITNLYHEDIPFEITYNNHAKTVTITALCDDNNDVFDEALQWYDGLKFRVYNPATEAVPRFDSTTYTYQGIKGERAPTHTIIGKIGKSVRIIEENAFNGCTQMQFCIMHDDVEIIEHHAFYYCFGMKAIKLSKSLKRIGEYAFNKCEALDAVFIPPTIERIGMFAFSRCCDLRILSLPPKITTREIGGCILHGCDTFFSITQIQIYNFQAPLDSTNIDDDNQAVIDFHLDLPPLHKTCLDTNVSAQTIHDCVIKNASASTISYGGMTPLHILAMNPHATTESIIACFELDMSAALDRDTTYFPIGLTPIDYLMDHGNFDPLVALIQALCIYREAHNSKCTKYVGQVSKRQRVL